MTTPAKIAAFIMTLAVSGLIACSFYIPHAEGAWLFFLLALRHGFEGALVGGVCDFIAVRQVYTKARNNFVRMVDGVSKTVVLDMIRLRSLLEKGLDVSAWLEQEDNLQWFQQHLQEWLPDSRNHHREKLEELWDERLHHEVVDWLMHSNPKSFLFGQAKHVGLLNSPVLRESLAKCLEKIAEDDRLATNAIEKLIHISENITLMDLGLPTDQDELSQLADDFWLRWRELGSGSKVQDFLAERVIKMLIPALAARIEKLPLSEIMRPALEQKKIQIALQRLAQRVRVPQSSDISDALMEGVFDYLEAFVEAWLALAESQRKESIESIVSAVKPLLFAMAIDVILALRQALLQPVTLVENELVKELLHKISVHLMETSPLLEQQAKQALERRLAALGPDGFVQLLRKSSQQHLDWIKVNGTAWGFVLGSIIGLGLAWLEHM